MLPIFFLALFSGALSFNVSQLEINKSQKKKPVFLGPVNELNREKLIVKPILDAIYEQESVKIGDIVKNLEDRQKYPNGSSRHKTIIKSYINMRKRNELKFLRQKINFVKMLNDNSSNTCISQQNAEEMRELAKDIVTKASLAKIDIIDELRKGIGLEGEQTINAISLSESKSKARKLRIWKDHIALGWAGAIAESEDPKNTNIAIESMLQDIRLDIHWDLSILNLSRTINDFNDLNSIADAKQNVQPETLLRRVLHSIVDVTSASLNRILHLADDKSGILRYIVNKEAAEIKMLSKQAFEVVYMTNALKLCNTFLD